MSSSGTANESVGLTRGKSTSSVSVTAQERGTVVSATRHTNKQTDTIISHIQHDNERPRPTALPWPCLRRCNLHNLSPSPASTLHREPVPGGAQRGASGAQARLRSTRRRQLQPAGHLRGCAEAAQHAAVRRGPEEGRRGQKRRRRESRCRSSSSCVFLIY